MEDFLELERGASLALRKADCEDFFFFGDEERRDIPCQ
jgi:hypothetical protein